MNVKPWTARKNRKIRRGLVSLDESVVEAGNIAADNGSAPRIVTLCHNELKELRAKVYLHGQRAGTYGIFFEYPHLVPGILESDENLRLQQLLASPALHFDA